VVGNPDLISRAKLKSELGFEFQKEGVATGLASPLEQEATLRGELLEAQQLLLVVPDSHFLPTIICSFSTLSASPTSLMVNLTGLHLFL
jgi:hypothetical protein